MTRAPLRFLIAVMVLWTGARTAILLPGWRRGMIGVLAADAAQTPEIAGPPLPATPAPIAIMASSPFPPPAYPVGRKALSVSRRRTDAPIASGQAATLPMRQLSYLLRPSAQFSIRSGRKQAPTFGAALPPVDHSGSLPWSGSAWLLVRDRGDAALAPGGTLGGSQAGARVNYALSGGLALSGRVYVPLRQPSGAEFAAGIDWRPAPSLPVHLIVERRQRLGRNGRAAFAVTAYAGGSHALSPHTRIDVYGQAGMVGVKSRDLFADGALRMSRRIGPVELGVAAWGAAQPGAARLDAGPSLSWRLPARANLRLQADWRFRLAGDATPSSGPALTLAADF